MKRGKRKIKKIFDELSARKSFVAACHVNPEGDALGSILALTNFLQGLGKRAQAFCPDKVPPILQFLPGAEYVVNSVSGLDKPEAIIVADCGDPARTGKEFENYIREFQKNAVGPVINIDHHQSNTMFGDLNCVQSDASSTCEIIYSIFRTHGADLSLDVATCLYTGLVHDTGSFRYSNTNAATLEAAAFLVKKGVKPDMVCANLYENQPPERIRLLALALSTLRFEDNGRRAEIYITKEMFEKTDTGSDATEGFINHLSALKGVEVAMTFRQESGSIYKVSFRSKGGADVGSIAEELGGGGHRQAAGATLEGSLEDVRRLVHQTIDRHGADRE